MPKKEIGLASDPRFMSSFFLIALSLGQPLYWNSNACGVLFAAKQTVKIDQRTDVNVVIGWFGCMVNLVSRSLWRQKKRARPIGFCG
jgi:hypothetical protein